MPVQHDATTILRVPASPRTEPREGAAAAKRICDGKGHRAYRRAHTALKRRTARENPPCGCGCGSDDGCGEPIDKTLPATDRMSFTADHPIAVANGGHLV